MELIDKVVPDGWYEGQRNAIRNAIQDKNSNWYKLILRIYDLDPGVREAFFTNFITNASLKGSAIQQEDICRRTTATYRGRSFWILQVPVICTAQDAGQLNTVTN